jgi:hypothetical protein
VLTLCETEGFDVPLTGDQNLSYQQVIAGRRIAVVILDTLDLNALRKFAGSIVDAIDRATPGELPGCAIKLEEIERGDCGTANLLQQFAGIRNVSLYPPLYLLRLRGLKPA